MTSTEVTKPKEEPLVVEVDDRQVLACASHIRDFVNRPRLNYLLQQRGGLWFQLCSAMDVVEDATLAIGAYVELPPPRVPERPACTWPSMARSRRLSFNMTPPGTWPKRWTSTSTRPPTRC